MYVNWQTTSKEKLICVLRLFGADNKTVSEANHAKSPLGREVRGHHLDILLAYAGGHLPGRI